MTSGTDSEDTATPAPFTTYHHDDIRSAGYNFVILESDKQHTVLPGTVVFSANEAAITWRSVQTQGNILVRITSRRILIHNSILRLLFEGDLKLKAVLGLHRRVSSNNEHVNLEVN